MYTKMITKMYTVLLAHQHNFLQVLVNIIENIVLVSLPPSMDLK